MDLLGNNDLLASNDTVAQGGNLPESGNTTPQVSNDILGMNASSAKPTDPQKLNEEKLKVLQELLKTQALENKPDTSEGKPYNLLGQPDTALVKDEYNNLTTFLSQLAKTLHSPSTPQNGVYPIDPKGVKEALGDISKKMAGIQQQMEQIKPPGGSIPKEQGDLYNQLTLEHAILTKLGGIISNVDPKNPGLPADKVDSLVNEMNMYSDKVPSGQKNAYSLADIKSLLGTSANPTIQSYDDMAARIKYIQALANPMINQSLQDLYNPHGADPISNVNERLNMTPTQAKEKAAATALVNLVHSTYTLPKEQRESIWNMFPIWAASEGLNYGNIKAQGVQQAEEKARKWAGEGTSKTNTTSTPNTIISTIPKSSKLPEDSVMPTESAQDQSQSRLGGFLSGVGKTARKVGQGVADTGESVLQALAAPEAAATEFLTDPSKPSYSDAYKQMTPSWTLDAPPGPLSPSQISPPNPLAKLLKDAQLRNEGPGGESTPANSLLFQGE
jgi:hypothetical protein